jgi:hypothetical protein
MIDLMPRLVQAQQRQAQMVQIMELLQRQLDASRRIATQQADPPALALAPNPSPSPPNPQPFSPTQP